MDHGTDFEPVYSRFAENSPNLKRLWYGFRTEPKSYLRYNSPYYVYYSAKTYAIDQTWGTESCGQALQNIQYNPYICYIGFAINLLPK
jgi:hypothetical protein